ncbi:MAG: TetR/AcrR family transcriptional regulator [Clostridia bacterium]|nr:TetR/AcrR family transcriptional regulator [Clostridia bacterium]
MYFDSYCKPTFLRLPSEKQNRILSAGLSVFSLNGYHDAKMTEIAKKGGVSVGSLYKYFDNKHMLFLALVGKTVSRMEELLRELLNTDMDILLKTERIIRSVQQFSREDTMLIKLYQAMTAESDPTLAESFAVEMESVTARIYLAAVSEGQRLGEVRKDIDPGIAAYLMSTLFMSLQFSYACDYHKKLFRIYLGDSLPDHDDFVVEQLLRFIKSALKQEEKR